MEVLGVFGGASVNTFLNKFRSLSSVVAGNPHGSQTRSTLDVVDS